MVLTSKDREELHAAVVEYLRERGISSQITTQLQAQLSAMTPPSLMDSETPLERRWNTLKRLSLRNAELEIHVKQLTTQLNQLEEKKKIVRDAELLPTEPCSSVLRGHTDAITAVCAHPSDTQCISASADGTVKIWDLNASKVLSTISVQSENGGSVSVTCLAVEEVRDTVVLAAGCTDCTVRLYKASDDFSLVHSLWGHSEAVMAMAFVAAAEGVLVTASWDGDLRVWDAAKGVMKASYHSNVHRIRAVVGHAETVYFVGSDNAVGVWNWSSNHLVARFPPLHTNTVESLCLSNTFADAVLEGGHAEPDEAAEPHHLASGGRDKLIHIFHLPSQKSVLTIATHANWVRCVRFAGCGKHILSASDDGQVHLFDLVSRRPLRKIAAHDQAIVGFAQQLCGRNPVFITGSSDRTLKLWPTTG